MKWDNETGLPVPGTYQSKNRQLERLFLSGIYHSQLGSNPVRKLDRQVKLKSGFFSYMPCNNRQGGWYIFPEQQKHTQTYEKQHCHSPGKHIVQHQKH